MEQIVHPERKLPSKSQAVLFRGKAALFQLKRAIENLRDSKIKKFAASDSLIDKLVLAESKTPLWTESDRAELPLVAGKIHNLRLSVEKLNGIEIGAGEIFSFWAQIGRASRARGFVAGRELREGCIVPNVGGGLCQLSNALYDAAVQAGFTIVERHAHTQIIPGSLAETGRDATVFWNYVDLRFKSPAAFRIEAELTDKNLIVRFRGENPTQKLIQIGARIKNSQPENAPNSCATCGVGDCFRNLKPEPNREFGRAAFLVDEFSPEFDQYLQQNRRAQDLQQNRRAQDSLFVPLDGKRFKKANYAWTTDGFAQTRQSFLATMIRSYKSRRLAAQGASRQRNLLAMSEKLAARYAEQLNFDVLHVTVQQNLLPFLWRDGHLGGRTFDVLMTALPMRELQEQLDLAASLHPESPTLGDFRAPGWLVAAETAALDAARKIVTPHSRIAAIFADKAELLAWQMPPAKSSPRRSNAKFTIVFPASTVGRKGAYELRAALSGLESAVKLIVLGAELEGADFWRGFEVEHKTNDWLEAADLVVLPAFVEHKPRRLLLAAARNIPVVASAACGLETVAGVESVAVGDVQALREKLLTYPLGAAHNQALKMA